MASFRETPMITLILSKLHIEFEVVKIFCRVFDGSNWTLGHQLYHAGAPLMLTLV